MDGSATIDCDDPPEVWEDWRDANEPGATLAGLPSDDDLLEWARAVLPALAPAAAAASPAARTS